MVTRIGSSPFPITQWVTPTFQHITTLVGIVRRVSDIALATLPFFVGSVVLYILYQSYKHQSETPSRGSSTASSRASSGESTPIAREPSNPKKNVTKQINDDDSDEIEITDLPNTSTISDDDSPETLLQTPTSSRKNPEKKQNDDSEDDTTYTLIPRNRPQKPSDDDPDYPKTQNPTPRKPKKRQEPLPPMTSTVENNGSIKVVISTLLIEKDSSKIPVYQGYLIVSKIDGEVNPAHPRQQTSTIIYEKKGLVHLFGQ